MKDKIQDSKKRIVKSATFASIIGATVISVGLGVAIPIELAWASKIEKATVDLSRYAQELQNKLGVSAKELKGDLGNGYHYVVKSGNTTVYRKDTVTGEEVLVVTAKPDGHIDSAAKIGGIGAAKILGLLNRTQNALKANNFEVNKILNPIIKEVKKVSKNVEKVVEENLKTSGNNVETALKKSKEQIAKIKDKAKKEIVKDVDESNKEILNKLSKVLDKVSKGNDKRSKKVIRAIYDQGPEVWLNALNIDLKENGKISSTLESYLTRKRKTGWKPFLSGANYAKIIEIIKNKINDKNARIQQVLNFFNLSNRLHVYKVSYSKHNKTSYIIMQSADPSNTPTRSSIDRLPLISMIESIQFFDGTKKNQEFYTKNMGFIVDELSKFAAGNAYNKKQEEYKEDWALIQMLVKTVRAQGFTFVNAQNKPIEYNKEEKTQMNGLYEVFKNFSNYHGIVSEATKLLKQLILNPKSDSSEAVKKNQERIEKIAKVVNNIKKLHKNNIEQKRPALSEKSLGKLLNTITGNNYEENPDEDALEKTKNAIDTFLNSNLYHLMTKNSENPFALDWTKAISGQANVIPWNQLLKTSLAKEKNSFEPGENLKKLFKIISHLITRYSKIKAADFNYLVMPITRHKVLLNSVIATLVDNPDFDKDFENSNLLLWINLFNNEGLAYKKISKDIDMEQLSHLYKILEHELKNIPESSEDLKYVKFIFSKIGKVLKSNLFTLTKFKSFKKDLLSGDTSKIKQWDKLLQDQDLISTVVTGNAIGKNDEGLLYKILCKISKGFKGKGQLSILKNVIAKSNLLVHSTFWKLISEPKLRADFNNVNSNLPWLKLLINKDNKLRDWAINDGSKFELSFISELSNNDYVNYMDFIKTLTLRKDFEDKTQIIINILSAGKKVVNSEIFDLYKNDKDNLLKLFDYKKLQSLLLDQNKLKDNIFSMASAQHAEAPMNDKQFISIFRFINKNIIKNDENIMALFTSSLKNIKLLINSKFVSLLGGAQNISNYLNGKTNADSGSTLINDLIKTHPLISWKDLIFKNSQATKILSLSEQAKIDLETLYRIIESLNSSKIDNSLKKQMTLSIIENEGAFVKSKIYYFLTNEKSIFASDFKDKSSKIGAKAYLNLIWDSSTHELSKLSLNDFTNDQISKIKLNNVNFTFKMMSVLNQFKKTYNISSKMTKMFKRMDSIDKTFMFKLLNEKIFNIDFNAYIKDPSGSSSNLPWFNFIYYWNTLSNKAIEDDKAINNFKQTIWGNLLTKTNPVNIIGWAFTFRAFNWKNLLLTETKKTEEPNQYTLTNKGDANEKLSDKDNYQTRIEKIIGLESIYNSLKLIHDIKGISQEARLKLINIFMDKVKTIANEYNKKFPNSNAPKGMNVIKNPRLFIALLVKTIDSNTDDATIVKNFNTLFNNFDKFEKSKLGHLFGKGIAGHLESKFFKDLLADKSIINWKGLINGFLNNPNSIKVFDKSKLVIKDESKINFNALMKIIIVAKKKGNNFTTQNLQDLINKSTDFFNSRYSDLLSNKLFAEDLDKYISSGSSVIKWGELLFTKVGKLDIYNKGLKIKSNLKILVINGKAKLLSNSSKQGLFTLLKEFHKIKDLGKDPDTLSVVKRELEIQKEYLEYDQSKDDPSEYLITKLLSIKSFEADFEKGFLNNEKSLIPWEKFVVKKGAAGTYIGLVKSSGRKASNGTDHDDILAVFSLIRYHYDWTIKHAIYNFKEAYNKTHQNKKENFKSLADIETRIIQINKDIESKGETLKAMKDAPNKKALKNQINELNKLVAKLEKLIKDTQAVVTKFAVEKLNDTAKFLSSAIGGLLKFKEFRVDLDSKAPKIPWGDLLNPKNKVLVELQEKPLDFTTSGLTDPTSLESQRNASKLMVTLALIKKMLPTKEELSKTGSVYYKTGKTITDAESNQNKAYRDYIVPEIIKDSKSFLNSIFIKMISSNDFNSINHHIKGGNWKNNSENGFATDLKLYIWNVEHANEISKNSSLAKKTMFDWGKIVTSSQVVSEFSNSNYSKKTLSVLFMIMKYQKELIKSGSIKVNGKNLSGDQAEALLTNEVIHLKEIINSNVFKYLSNDKFLDDFNKNMNGKKSIMQWKKIIGDIFIESFNKNPQTYILNKHFIKTQDIQSFNSTTYISNLKIWKDNLWKNKGFNPNQETLETLFRIFENENKFIDANIKAKIEGWKDDLTILSTKKTKWQKEAILNAKEFLNSTIISSIVGDNGSFMKDWSTEKNPNLNNNDGNSKFMKNFNQKKKDFSANNKIKSLSKWTNRWEEIVWNYKDFSGLSSNVEFWNTTISDFKKYQKTNIENMYKAKTLEQVRSLRTENMKKFETDEEKKADDKLMKYLVEGIMVSLDDHKKNDSGWDSDMTSEKIWKILFSQKSLRAIDLITNPIFQKLSETIFTPGKKTIGQNTLYGFNPNTLMNKILYFAGSSVDYVYPNGDKQKYQHTKRFDGLFDWSVFALGVKSNAHDSRNLWSTGLMGLFTVLKNESKIFNPKTPNPEQIERIIAAFKVFQVYLSNKNSDTFSRFTRLLTSKFLKSKKLSVINGSLNIDTPNNVDDPNAKLYSKDKLTNLKIKLKKMLKTDRYGKINLLGHLSKKDKMFLKKMVIHGTNHSAMQKYEKSKILIPISLLNIDLGALFGEGYKELIKNKTIYIEMTYKQVSNIINNKKQIINTKGIKIVLADSTIKILGRLGPLNGKAPTFDSSEWFKYFDKYLYGNGTQNFQNRVITLNKTIGVTKADTVNKVDLNIDLILE